MDRASFENHDIFRNYNLTKCVRFRMLTFLLMHKWALCDRFSTILKWLRRLTPVLSFGIVCSEPVGRAVIGLLPMPVRRPA